MTTWVNKIIEQDGRFLAMRVQIVDFALGEGGLRQHDEWVSFSRCYATRKNAERALAKETARAKARGGQ